MKPEIRNQKSEIPVIILAGGLGTRLREVIDDLPKSMAPVNGKPFLHYIFQYLVRQNISEVILSVGYKRESIQQYFGDEYSGIKIKYSVEDEPLGTGGAIKKACSMCDELTFILNGDTLFDIDLNELVQHFSDTVSEITIALKPMENFERYGSVEMNKETRITAFNEKKFVQKGLINGGVYLIHAHSMLEKEPVEKFSFEKEILEKKVNNFYFAGKTFDNYFIDIGVPEDYAKAQEDFKKLFA